MCFIFIQDHGTGNFSIENELKHQRLQQTEHTGLIPIMHLVIITMCKSRDVQRGFKFPRKNMFEEIVATGA
jgi:hypothetical protein